MRLISLASFAIAASLALPATAAQPTASELLTGFNAIVSGNFSTGHDVESRVVIGGNLSGNGTFFNLGTPLGVNLAGFGAVNVYGSAGTAAYNANGLTVKVGAANSGSNFSGASSVQYNATLPVTFSSIWSTLTSLSSGLAGLLPTTPSGSLPAANSNNAVLLATPATVNGFANVAVIDIAASLLGSYTGVMVNLNGASTVIVNVHGNFTGKPNFMNGSSYNTNVIWNFVDATSVSLGAQGIQGTVLAPYAHVTNGTPIDGALIAKSYTGSGELHYKPFAGNTGFINSFGGTPPSPGGPSGSVTVPEPGTMLLLGVGLAGLGAMRRRRG